MKEIFIAANLSAHQDRHFLLFLSTKYYEHKRFILQNADDPTIQSVCLIVIIIEFFFRKKAKQICQKHPNKNPLHPIS